MAQGFNFKINEQAQSIEFAINTEIYSLTAIYHAAYLFLDKAYVFLDGDPKAEIIAIFTRKEGQKEENWREGLEKIAGEFYNELLNQLLREKVSESNAKIREYIVSAALYNAVPNEVDKLLQEVEEENWQEDPMGIAKSWEETQKMENDHPSHKASDGKGKKGDTG